MPDYMYEDKKKNNPHNGNGRHDYSDVPMPQSGPSDKASDYMREGYNKYNKKTNPRENY